MMKFLRLLSVSGGKEVSEMMERFIIWEKMKLLS
jgi:hypothetical protein